MPHIDGKVNDYKVTSKLLIYITPYFVKCKFVEKLS